VYSPRQRAAWLEKQQEAGVRRRAEQTYQQLVFSVGIRLEQIPRPGPIGVALPPPEKTRKS
jgi:hypothetical protein